VKRLRVGVLYGGRSGEHEVSLASAAAIFANLDRQRYEPVAIRIERDGRWVLSDRPPSAASAAEIIDQMRSEAARQRTGRDVIMPPRPGEDTLLLVERRADRGDETTAVLTAQRLDAYSSTNDGGQSHNCRKHQKRNRNRGNREKRRTIQQDPL
jgi:D-alanine-D-alanine ligase